MSLINDALKKAQKQRTGDGPELKTLPSIGGEPATRISQRGKSSDISSLIIRIGVGVFILAILVTGGIFLVRFITDQPETPVAAKPTVVAQSNPVHPTPEPAPKNPATPAPLPASTPAPVAVVANPNPAPVVVAETKPMIVAPVVTPPPQPEAPTINLKMEAKALTYIEALRVAGIRASATDSKVLMNDKVYRVGSSVEHQLGIKLVEITASSLTFEDERGARYTRNF